MLLRALKWSILGCILGLILILCHVPTVTSSSTCPAPLLLQLSNCTVVGTSVQSWGLKLNLADPSQFLCVVPSTVVNSTLVISSDFCETNSNLTTAQCESLSGNTFNTSAAGTSYTASSASVVLAPNPVWSEISPEALLAGTTELQLPPSSSSANNDLPKYPIGIITSGNHQNVGHLGLANDSDFLHFAVSNGIIPAHGFGFNAGSQSVANPRDGSLVLGGYDLASVGGAWFNSTITAVSSSERECPLQVTITSMVLRFPLAENSADVTVISSGVQVPACIEPYDNLFRLPQTVLQSFQDHTGWSADTTADPNLYIVEPGLYYPQTKGFNGSLIITLSNGFEVEIPNEELSNPLRGINANGARVLTQENITEVNIFYQNAPLDTATLGKVFLSQAYLAVDYTMNQFRLADIVSDAINSDPVPFNFTSAAACSNTSAGKGWSQKKTDILVGSLIPGLFLIAGGIIGFIYFRHRREVRQRENSQSSYVALGQGQQNGVQRQQTTTPHPSQELNQMELDALRNLPRRNPSESRRDPAQARYGQEGHESVSAVGEASG